MQSVSVYGVSKSLSRRKIGAPLVVAAAASSNRSQGDGNVVLMENKLNVVRESAPAATAPVTEKDSKSGVEDFYGEDDVSADQNVTPWAVTVAR